MPTFVSNLVKFGQIWAKMVHFWIFDKKVKLSFFLTPEITLRAKIGKFQAPFSKNAKNLCFWAFCVKMGQIGPKRGHFRICGEKVKTSPSFPIFLFFGENLANGERLRDRQRHTQRRVTIYRSESTQWASDQKVELETHKKEEKGQNLIYRGQPITFTAQ